MLTLATPLRGRGGSTYNVDINRYCHPDFDPRVAHLFYLVPGERTAGTVKYRNREDGRLYPVPEGAFYYERDADRAVTAWLRIRIRGRRGWTIVADQGECREIILLAGMSNEPGLRRFLQWCGHHHAVPPAGENLRRMRSASGRPEPGTFNRSRRASAL